MPLVSVRGINHVMAHKFAGERNLWMLHSALMDAFPDDYARTRGNLFPEALASIAQ
jgi:hypothetical protein